MRTIHEALNKLEALREDAIKRAQTAPSPDKARRCHDVADSFALAIRHLQACILKEANRRDH